jgi:hypothetical protein
VFFVFSPSCLNTFTLNSSNVHDLFIWTLTYLELQ